VGSGDLVCHGVGEDGIWCVRLQVHIAVSHGDAASACQVSIGVDVDDQRGESSEERPLGDPVGSFASPGAEREQD